MRKSEKCCQGERAGTEESGQKKVLYLDERDVIKSSIIVGGDEVKKSGFDGLIVDLEGIYPTLLLGGEGGKKKKKESQ